MIVMPDSILASIIAAAGTISAAILQLRMSLSKDSGARSQSPGSRRKSNRAMIIALLVIVTAAGVAGFALSQWLTQNQRAAMTSLEQELRARTEDIGRTASQLELARTGARAEIEMGVLRRIGSDGLIVTARVAPCRPAIVSASGATAPPPGVVTETLLPAAATCTEAEGNSVTLCATIPANATVTDVQLYSRFADANSPWDASRALPGQESGLARFAEKYAETPDGAGTKQVCQGFTHWSAERARIARMIVHYSL